MLPIYLKVKNFTSYAEETIDFEKLNSLFCVIGSNGVGKSSIIDIITAAIFYRARGTDAKGSNMENLIRNNEDKFEIEFCFMMNDNKYVIIREKPRKGSQTLKLIINDSDVSGKLNETQKMIDDIIRVDYDTFMDTVCIGQGQSSNFMKKKPNERKKIISQILQLYKYNVLEKYTKETKKELKIKMDNMKYELEKLYNSISKENEVSDNLNICQNSIVTMDEKIKQLEIELEKELVEKTKYEELKKQQQSIINRKNKIYSNINLIKNDITTIQNDKNKLMEKINYKKDNIDNINKYTNEIETTSNIIFDINKKLTTIEVENKSLYDKINDLKQKYSNLKHYNALTCKFCGQQITPDHKEKHLSELMAEGVNLQKKYTENISIINNLKIQLKSKNDYLNDLKLKLNSEKNKKELIVKAEMSFENLSYKLIDFNNKLEELNKEKEEIDNINLNTLEDKYFKDSELKYNIQQLRNNFNDCKMKIGILKSKLEQINLDKVEYEKMKSKEQEIINKFNIYDSLQVAWGKNGIQAIIIDNIIPQIEEEINKYLSILTSDRISLHFDTLKTAKNGNKSETLDIYVNVDGVTRPYENFSGGEKMRIDFACHIGMSKFLAKRSGANIDFFVVDEGIGTLDDEGKNSFIEMLNLLKLIFKKIMVISHIDDIKEAFDNKLIINKDLFNGSKVSIL